MAKAIGKMPKTTPRETIKVATTFNNTCPATILANKRTDNVTGRIKNEKNSIKNINGAIHAGTPEGKNILINPKKPFLAMAKIVIARKAIIAKAKVTAK